MSTTREDLVERVNELPDTYLDDLAEFIDYLFWKHQATTMTVELPTLDEDPLIGLFAGESDLAERSEDILAQEGTTYAGWTWKKSQE
jgi:hypothetical protein